MKRPRSAIAAVLAALAALAAAASTAAVAPAAAAVLPVGQIGPVGGGPLGGVASVAGGVVRLADSVAPFATAARAVGIVPAASRLTVQFWLAPQAKAAEGFATAVSTPGNPLFGRYLSPAGYAARFGATRGTAHAVESWLRSAGFSGVGTDLGRDYVRATADVSTIDRVLGTRLRYYRPEPGAGAGRFPLRANDGPLALPAGIAASIAGVTGLDNAAPTMTYARAGNPAAPPSGSPGAPGQTGSDGPPGPPGTSGDAPSYACSKWYQQHYANGLPRQFGTTKFPTVICGYTPQQLRQAYGYRAADDGKGVTVALVEVGLTPDMFQTLQDYAHAHGLHPPSAQRYAELSLGGGSGCGDPFNIEEQLDVEASYNLAPGARQLVVGGDSCNNGDYGLQALFDADTAILDGAGGHPLAQIASNSWEGGDEAIPANLLQVEHDYLVKAAAEGVTMLFSTGDSSGVEVPSSDPYATAVGATTLGLGRGGARLFETGWSTGISSASGGRWVFQGEQGAAGGGASLLWRQPAYQRGVVPKSLATAPGNRGGLVRTVPDISADGDPFTGMVTGMLNLDAQGKVTGYLEESIGGTSLAAPLVAAVLADAEQGSRAFGFINPALYRLARSGAFHDARPLTGARAAGYRGVACDQNTCGVASLTTFDDQSWQMTGYTGQVTRVGYDTMTGLGTPDAGRLIAALRAL